MLLWMATHFDSSLTSCPSVGQIPGQRSRTTREKISSTMSQCEKSRGCQAGQPAALIHEAKEDVHQTVLAFHHYNHHTTESK